MYMPVTMPATAHHGSAVCICARCGIYARYGIVARYGIDARDCVDRVFLNYHRRGSHDDGSANHNRFAHDGCRARYYDWRRSPILIGVDFPLIRRDFAIASYWQIGGKCRRGKSYCTCCAQD